MLSRFSDFGFENGLNRLFVHDCICLFSDISEKEITTILTPSTSEGGGGGGHIFYFGGP